MPNVTQYMFSNSEMLRMLLDKQGITEGFWSLTIEFSLAATMAGPSPEELIPSAILGVKSIGLQRSEEKVPGSIDAAALLGDKTKKK